MMSNSTSLTEAQTAALEELLADWKSDDNKAYGWEGPAEGADFVTFWLDGAGNEEVLKIVGDDDDMYRAAVKYLERAA